MAGPGGAGYAGRTIVADLCAGACTVSCLCVVEPIAGRLVALIAFLVVVCSADSVGRSLGSV